MRTLEFIEAPTSIVGLAVGGHSGHNGTGGTSPLKERGHGQSGGHEGEERCDSDHGEKERLVRMCSQRL